MAGSVAARVVVTGAAGFIGSHLVERLLIEGYEVIAVDDLSSGQRQNLPAGGTPRFRFVQGDVCDEALSRELCDGAAAVFHQAARSSVSRSFARPRDALTVNTLGCLSLLEAARAAGVPRFIYASSSSVYGPSGQGPCCEQSPVRPRSPYAVSKLAAEELARTFSEQYQLMTIGLRYFNVFGPRQLAHGEYAAVVPRFITACLRGDSPVIYGDGSAARDFTYVDNVVDANLCALRAEALLGGRIYNIGCGAAHTVTALYEHIAQRIQPGPAPIYAPERPGDVRSSLADLRAAAAELGYRPRVDLHAGLALTISWYKERLEQGLLQ